MREIFCDRKVIQNFDQARGEMRLSESETGQSIKIGGIPVDAILLKLDVDSKEYKVRSAYLRNGLEFIHKGCDYCLIIPQENKAILFELKSNHPKGYANQFVASELFIEYCTKLWNKFNCTNITLDFTRVLLSPKFNRAFTTTGKILNLESLDRCNNEVKIISPGFPNQIRLERFL